MSLENISYVSQAFSALAIAVSLILVVLQLRQSDKTQRALMHQTALQRTMDTNMFIFGAANAPLLDKVARGDANLGAAEVLQLGGIVRTTVLNLEDVLWQQQAGFLDEATVRGVIVSMRRWFATPGMRVAWALFRAGYSEEQIRLVETLVLANSPTGPATDFSLVWKAAAERI